MNKAKILKFSNDYTAPKYENLFTAYDAKLNTNGRNYYICLVQSIGAGFNSIEAFFPAALFNSLEDVYRDEDYEYFVSITDPTLLTTDDFIEFLQSIDLTLNISIKYVHLMCDISSERFFVGELINGGYFSLAVLDFD